MELLLLECLKRTLSHDQEILVLLQLTYQTIIVGKIFGDLSVDQSDQKRTSYILHTLQCFLVVVEICQCNYQFVVLIRLNIILKFCLVIEIHGDQTGAVRDIHQKFRWCHGFSKEDSLHGYTVNVLSKLCTDLCDFSVRSCRKLVCCDVCKNRIDIFAVELVPAGDL